MVAIPLTRGERVSRSIARLGVGCVGHGANRNDILLMVAIGAVAVMISALIGLGQSRRLARPVDRLAAAATRLGHGDFTVRSEVSGVPEVDAVSEALETTAVRLDRMLGRERSFSDDASHQLRTPLTSLRVTLEAARLHPTADPDGALAAALADVDRLDRTIDDLLALARETSTQRADTDLAVVLAELDHDWRRRTTAAARPFEVVS